MNNQARAMRTALCDSLLHEVAGVFAKQGKQVYLVGGAVRDMILKKKSADWDLATNAQPDDVQKMFRHVIPTGIKHGTVTVMYKGRAIEVTTFRTEHDYSDGRRPDKVEYAATIEEDLSRRDFTMNAMALDLSSGKIVDPFGGACDIEKKLIRCVGAARERFSEDGLRPLRALRFASQLQFSLDPELLDAIPATSAITAKVSRERVRDEFEKIIASKNPLIALRVMEQTGLLQMFFPDLARCRGVEQKGYHRFDVLDHSFYALDYAARTDAPQSVRLAALFHDIGKPDTAARGNDDQGQPTGAWTFYNHEKISAQRVYAIMSDLRYPNAARDIVVHLVEEHMFHYEDAWSAAAVRRFIIRVGEEHLQRLFLLRMADSYALAGIDPPPTLLLPLQKRIEKELEKGRAFSLKDLAVSGRDLMALGIPSGKRIGIILNQLLETVLDDPDLNAKPRLLEIAKNLNAAS